MKTMPKVYLRSLAMHIAMTVIGSGKYEPQFLEVGCHELSKGDLRLKHYSDRHTVVYHKGEIVFEARLGPGQIPGISGSAKISTYIPGDWEMKLLRLASSERIVDNYFRVVRGSLCNCLN